jgi:hypothetical protein
MEHPMAKPTKYPRKLRQKLERVAAARDERQTQEGHKVDPFVTFNQDFLPRGGVFALHAKLDGKRLQMLSYVTMLSPQQPEYVRARPPWEGETGASS